MFRPSRGSHRNAVQQLAGPPPSFRHVILVGVVALLLVAGFNHNAQAGTFTNFDLITYSQVDWAGVPFAATLIQANYNTLFASTSGVLEFGSPTGFTMVFDRSVALARYLPDVGPIGPLDAFYFDPTSSSAGAFGGDVVALTLNIDFSDAGLLPGNLGIRFGDLVLTNFTDLPLLNGLTVRQFCEHMNTVLGGGSYGSYTIAQLDPIVASLNASFEDGIAGIFATEQLTIAQVPPVMQAVSRSGSTITFTWNTTPGSMYQVQSITNLIQTNWINLGSPILATNITWTASETITNSQAFYRIALLPPQRTVPTNSGFITYDQTNWPDNPFAYALLQANYNTVFASTSGVLELGSPTGFAMVFTGTSELLAYLPALGTPAPLDGDLFDPTSSSAGQFGGDVAALALNIAFSDAGFLPGNPGAYFGDLVLVNFPPQPRGTGIKLLTVRQFSAVVNNVLGGSSYGRYTIAYLDSIVQDINGSFLDGAASAFGTNNLAVP